MNKLLGILTLIKKQVGSDSYFSALDRRSEEFSVYQKLKEGYQLLLQSSPESMLFEEYLRKESSDLLENALVVVEEEKTVAQEVKPTFIEISLQQIFRLFLPTNTISPLMTWEMR